jgi:hypothetical protein
MWMRKLSVGVLRVLTPMGPRYIQPALLQRVYLFWIFRNFEMLPLQVLSSRQQKLIDTLCEQERFVSLPVTIEMEDAPVIGTVEWRSRIHSENLGQSQPSKAVSAAVARMPEGAQQRP